MALRFSSMGRAALGNPRLYRNKMANAQCLLHFLPSVRLRYLQNQQGQIPPFRTKHCYLGVVKLCQSSRIYGDFLEYSPGLITSIIFLLIGILVLRKARLTGQLSVRVTVLSVACSLICWGLPMGLFIAVDLMLGI